MSSLTWLDYSERERCHAMEVIDLFREDDTRDELGLGTIRDPLSDLAVIEAELEKYAVDMSYAGQDGEVVPLDIALYPLFKHHGIVLRNRIVWHFEHGLHCSKHFSGRYETILWFTKGKRYTYHPIREPYKSIERLKHIERQAPAERHLSRVVGSDRPRALA